MADSVRAVIDRKQRFVAALFAFIKLLDFLSRSERRDYEISDSQAVRPTLTGVQQ